MSSCCIFLCNSGCFCSAYKFVSKNVSKRWKKEGQPKVVNSEFTGTLTFKETFIMLGGRYYFIKKNQNQNLLTYLGGGIASITANEIADGVWTVFGETQTVNDNEEISKTGFYVEGGVELPVNKEVTMRIFADYSFANLGKTETGLDAELGGLSIGISLNVLFGVDLFKH